MRIIKNRKPTPRMCEDTRDYDNVALCDLHHHMAKFNRTAMVQWKGLLFDRILNGLNCDDPRCDHSATTFFKEPMMPKYTRMSCQFHEPAVLRLGYRPIDINEYYKIYIESILES